MALLEEQPDRSTGRDPNAVKVGTVPEKVDISKYLQAY